jgi:hypothetical protein
MAPTNWIGNWRATHLNSLSKPRQISGNSLSIPSAGHRSATRIIGHNPYVLHTNRGYLPSMDQMPSSTDRDPVHGWKASSVEDPNHGWQQRSTSRDLLSMDNPCIHGLNVPHPWMVGPHWWIFAAIHHWGRPWMKRLIYRWGPDPLTEDIHGSCATYATLP